MTNDNKIKETALNILEKEQEAINSLKPSIDSDFVKAVKTILNKDEVSKVVVLGMGKAGFMGMKISATLSSIGIPSFFLHPAEALHGDLGRVGKKDIMLILSNSGETGEILRILPSFKKIGNTIISITGSKTSTLSKYSDIILSLNGIKEACPLGLAPTSTTTAMLALGDALSMAILNERNFTSEDFAFFHPGGALGRSLMKVYEIMRKGEFLCIVNEDEIIKDVVQKMTDTKGRPGCAIVINNNGTLSGIYTDGNLRRDLNKGCGFLNEKVKDYMGKSPKSIAPDNLIKEALTTLTNYEIDQIIVVDDKNIPIGLVDIQDVSKYF